MEIQEQIEKSLEEEIGYDKQFLTEEIEREVPRHMFVYHKCRKCDEINYDIAAFPGVDTDLLRQAFYVLIESISKVKIPCKECGSEEIDFLGYAMIFMGWYLFSKIHPDELLKDGPISEMPNKKEAYCAILSTEHGVKIYCYEVLRFEHHTELKEVKESEDFAKDAGGSFVVDIKKLLGGEQKNARSN